MYKFHYCIDFFMYTIYTIYVALYNFFASVVINIITRAIAQGGKNGNG